MATHRLLAALIFALLLTANGGRAEGSGFGPDHLPAVSDAEDPLVDASTIVPGLVVRLIYATKANIAGRALYPDSARCLLRQSVAARLADVAQSLSPRGIRLVAWDCTRPRSAQVALFQAHPHPGAVADPQKGSLHQRGVAIDLALADEKGSLLPLPTGFDAFGLPAYADAPIPDGPEKTNRDLLIAAMRQAGFRPNPKEWWHFSRLWGFRWPEARDDQLWPEEKLPKEK